MHHRVILCAPNNSSFSPGIIRALNSLGSEVAFFDYRNKTILEKITRLLPKCHETKIEVSHDGLVKMAEKISPDLILVLKGESIDKTTIELLRGLGIKVVNWFPDYVNTLKLTLKICGYYNHFFHFDPLVLSELKKRGKKNVYYLPFAADLLPKDVRIKKKVQLYNISFVGNYDEYRENYLSAISDLGLHIWGDRRWAKSSLTSCYMGNQLPNSKFSEISRSSKININIQHGYPCEGLVLRPYEILGAGAFLLTENSRDAKKLFKEKIATFVSPDDLRRKVIYFLDHNKERERFAVTGYSAVKFRHTYIHRLKSIFKVIESSNEE